MARFSLFFVAALMSITTLHAADIAGQLSEGSVLEVARPFRFGNHEPRLHFQDGAPRSEKDLDQEKPFCSLALRTSGAATPEFRPGDRLVVTGSMGRMYGGLAADVTRLQLDPRINLLICWGVRDAFPSLREMQSALGAYLKLPVSGR